MYQNPLIKGFTTNPTLLRKAGVSDYKAFALDILKTIPDRPICFEVFSDDFDKMEEEAYKIASWGPNVYVKIPITNTKGESSIPLIKKLSVEGLQLNVTAILTIDQVEGVSKVLTHANSSIVSMFAGRIADTGRDPVPYIAKGVDILKSNPNTELLWASSRELLNIFQAESCGCHIITITNDILKKIYMIGNSLEQLSLETVKMFYKEAQEANYKIMNDKKGVVYNK